MSTPWPESPSADARQWGQQPATWGGNVTPGATPGAPPEAPQAPQQAWGTQPEQAWGQPPTAQQQWGEQPASGADAWGAQQAPQQQQQGAWGAGQPDPQQGAWGGAQPDTQQQWGQQPQSGAWGQQPAQPDQQQWSTQGPQQGGWGQQQPQADQSWGQQQPGGWSGQPDQAWGQQQPQPDQAWGQQQPQPDQAWGQQPQAGAWGGQADQGWGQQAQQPAAWGGQPAVQQWGGQPDPSWGPGPGAPGQWQPQPTQPPKGSGLRGLVSRISPRTAIIAGAGAALLFGLLLLVPHLGGDDKSNGGGRGGTEQGATENATPAPAGTTAIGPLAFALPEAAGPWTMSDTSDMQAAIDPSQYPDGQLPELFQYTGGGSTTGILVSKMPAGVTNIDGIDNGIANVKELLGGDTTVNELTWTGSLPSRAAELDAGGFHMVIVYIGLPDGSVVSVSANWDASNPASAELTNAVLTSTYTG